MVVEVLEEPVPMYHFCAPWPGEADLAPHNIAKRTSTSKAQQPQAALLVPAPPLSPGCGASMAPNASLASPVLFFLREKENSD